MKCVMHKDAVRWKTRIRMTVVNYFLLTATRVLSSMIELRKDNSAPAEKKKPINVPTSELFFRLRLYMVVIDPS